MRTISSKSELLKFRIMVIEKLRLLKKLYSYRELSAITGVPETVLCRYVKGSIIPSLDQAEKIWEKLNNTVDIPLLIKDRIEITANGVINITDILSDPYMLQLISHHAYQAFAGKRVTKILTPEINAIPLATTIGLTLQVPIIIAKKSMEAGTEDYYEDSFIRSPNTVITLYVPRKHLKKKDEVLIVDDIIRTGKTVRCLINIVRKARASISGIMTLVTIGDDWKEKIDLPVESILQISTAKRIM